MFWNHTAWKSFLADTVAVVGLYLLTGPYLIEGRCRENDFKKSQVSSSRCGRANNNYRSETCLDVTVRIRLNGCVIRSVHRQHTAVHMKSYKWHCLPSLSSTDPRRSPGWMWYLHRGWFTLQDRAPSWRCWSPWHRLPAVPPRAGHWQV